MRYVIIKVKCYKKMAKPEGEDDGTGNDSSSWDKVPQVNNCTAYEKTKKSDHTIQFHSVSLDYLQYKSEKANLDIISPPQSQGSTILHKTGSTNQEVDPQSRSRKLQI
jgi:hypothetical protein